MDFTAIGAWAGDKGPYLFVIGGLLGIIKQLLTRLLAQQDAVLKAMQLQERATKVADLSTQVVEQMVADK